MNELEDEKEIDTNFNLNISKEKNTENDVSINSISINIDKEMIPIVDQLIEIGYSKLYSKRLIAYYHPKTIEEVLNYLLKENGQIQHFFIEDLKIKNEKLCFLCGEKREIHLGYIPVNFNNILLENNNNIIKSKDIWVGEENANDMDKDLISNENEINKDSLIIKKEEECPICSDLFFPMKENTLDNCGHSFCNNCWYNFLSIKIKENKLTFIKCLDYECQEKLSDEFIINLLKSNKNLINQYEKYKFDLDIINNPNKKFCPYPNCNSFAELKEIKNKNVKCLNNHKFCFLCLEKPHDGKPCKDILDKSMQKFSKNNFIKKCPHCGIITEKAEGCNHITCSKCNYQWCWLCNGKYTTEHFREGKCRGFQFFKPKNENDIKLAFEGKINLNQSQLQQDLEINDRERRREEIRREREAFDNFVVPNRIQLRRGVRRHKFCSIFYLKKMIKKIILFIILSILYLLFGYFFILIHSIGKEAQSNFFEKLNIYCFISSIILILIPIFFIQIIINLILFILYFTKIGFINFFENFLDIVLLKDYNNEFDDIINDFISMIFILFGVDIFLKFFHYIKIKEKIRKKVFITVYYFIGLLHIIIYFQKYILFGSIRIILKYIKGISFYNYFDNLWDN